MLYIESFEHYKKFFVIYIIVEFNNLECVRMEYNWINLSFFHYDQRNSYESIFRDISFYNYLSIGYLIDKVKVNDFLRILNAL